MTDRITLQNTKQDTHQQSLGQALLVLFQSNRTAVRKALADIEGESNDLPTHFVRWFIESVD
jgi:hypothetical protein